MNKETINKLEKVYKMLQDKFPLDNTVTECRGILDSIIDEWYSNVDTSEDPKLPWNDLNNPWYNKQKPTAEDCWDGDSSDSD